MSRNGTATLERNEGLAGRIAQSGNFNKADFASISPSDAAWVVVEAAILCVERNHYHAAVNILVDAYRSRAELGLSEEHSEAIFDRARETREQGGLGNVHGDVLCNYVGNGSARR